MALIDELDLSRPVRIAGQFWEKGDDAIYSWAETLGVTPEEVMANPQMIVNQLQAEGLSPKQVALVLRAQGLQDPSWLEMARVVEQQGIAETRPLPGESAIDFMRRQAGDRGPYTPGGPGNPLDVTGRARPARPNPQLGRPLELGQRQPTQGPASMLGQVFDRPEPMGPGMERRLNPSGWYPPNSWDEAAETGTRVLSPSVPGTDAMKGARVPSGLIEPPDDQILRGLIDNLFQEGVDKGDFVDTIIDARIRAQQLGRDDVVEELSKGMNRLVSTINQGQDIDPADVVTIRKALGSKFAQGRAVADGAVKPEGFASGGPGRPSSGPGFSDPVGDQVVRGSRERGKISINNKIWRKINAALPNDPASPDNARLVEMARRIPIDKESDRITFSWDAMGDDPNVRQKTRANIREFLDESMRHYEKAVADGRVDPMSTAQRDSLRKVVDNTFGKGSFDRTISNARATFTDDATKAVDEIFQKNARQYWEDFFTPDVDEIGRFTRGRPGDITQQVMRSLNRQEPGILDFAARNQMAGRAPDQLPIGEQRFLDQVLEDWKNSREYLSRTGQRPTPASRIGLEIDPEALAAQRAQRLEDLNITNMPGGEQAAAEELFLRSSNPPDLTSPAARQLLDEGLPAPLVSQILEQEKAAEGPINTGTTFTPESAPTQRQSFPRPIAPDEWEKMSLGERYRAQMGDWDPVEQEELDKMAKSAKAARAKARKAARSSVASQVSDRSLLREGMDELQNTRGSASSKLEGGMAKAYAAIAEKNLTASERAKAVKQFNEVFADDFRRLFDNTLIPRGGLLNTKGKGPRYASYYRGLTPFEALSKLYENENEILKQTGLAERSANRGARIMSTSYADPLSEYRSKPWSTVDPDDVNDAVRAVRQAGGAQQSLEVAMQRLKRLGFNSDALMDAAENNPNRAMQIAQQLVDDFNNPNSTLDAARLDPEDIAYRRSIRESQREYAPDYWKGQWEPGSEPPKEVIDYQPPRRAGAGLREGQAPATRNAIKKAVKEFENATDYTQKSRAFRTLDNLNISAESEQMLRAMNFDTAGMTEGDAQRVLSRVARSAGRATVDPDTGLYSFAQRDDANLARLTGEDLPEGFDPNRSMAADAADPDNAVRLNQTDELVADDALNNLRSMVGDSDDLADTFGARVGSGFAPDDLAAATGNRADDLAAGVGRFLEGTPGASVAGGAGADGAEALRSILYASDSAPNAAAGVRGTISPVAAFAPSDVLDLEQGGRSLMGEVMGPGATPGVIDEVVKGTGTAGAGGAGASTVAGLFGDADNFDDFYGDTSATTTSNTPPRVTGGTKPKFGPGQSEFFEQNLGSKRGRFASDKLVTRANLGRKLGGAQFDDAGRLVSGLSDDAISQMRTGLGGAGDVAIAGMRNPKRLWDIAGLTNAGRFARGAGVGLLLDQALNLGIKVFDDDPTEDTDATAGWKGAARGGIVGGGIGSFFGPVGTAVGAGAGALIGGVGGYLNNPDPVEDIKFGDYWNDIDKAEAYSRTATNPRALNALRSAYMPQFSRIRSGWEGMDRSEKEAARERAAALQEEMLANYGSMAGIPAPVPPSFGPNQMQGLIRQVQQDLGPFVQGLPQAQQQKAWQAQLALPYMMMNEGLQANAAATPQGNGWGYTQNPFAGGFGGGGGLTAPSTLTEQALDPAMQAMLLAA